MTEAMVEPSWEDEGEGDGNRGEEEEDEEDEEEGTQTPSWALDHFTHWR